MAKNINTGILTVINAAPSLKGMQQLLSNAVNYMNASHDGKGNEKGYKWYETSTDLNFTSSVFRSLDGKDHTFFVLDYDPYPSDETRKMFTKIEVREFQLRAVMETMDYIRTKDHNFFNYMSGKGGYSIRKVYPSVQKQFFIDKIGDMLDKCNKNHSEDEYCELWHRKYSGRKSWYKWTTIDGQKIKVAIDLSIMDKNGVHVFRLPYSTYPKFAGNIFVCAPVIYDETGKINIAKTLTNTNPKYTELHDFEIPEEYLNISDYEGIVVDTKAVKTTSYKDYNKKFYGHIPLNIPAPYEKLTIEQKAVITRIEHELTGSPDKTPPCIKNAYLKEMPDAHWNRVLLGRYLFHRHYTLDEIALFIRFKINDEEDNSPEHSTQMATNIELFIKPTDDNPKLVPSCNKIQEPGGTFYACTPNDARICGRTYPLSSPKNTKASKAKKRAIKEQNIIKDNKKKIKKSKE